MKGSEAWFLFYFASFLQDLQVQFCKDPPILIEFNLDVRQYMSSSYMAIHCLLKRRRCSGTCLACCSRMRCIIGRRDGCYRHAAQLASWQRAHKTHCYSCLPTRDTRRHHTSHLQLGQLGIWHPLDLVVARTAMETRPSLLCTCCDSSTGPQGPQGPQNDIGSDTARTHSRGTRPNPLCRGHLRNQGQPLGLVSPCLLALQPVPVRGDAAPPSSINAICMRACFFHAGRILGLQCADASRHFHCYGIVAGAAASAVISSGNHGTLARLCHKSHVTGLVLFIANDF